jgi:hypothetical protein
LNEEEKNMGGKNVEEKNMNREQIINKLQSSFIKELPDIEPQEEKPQRKEIPVRVNGIKSSNTEVEAAIKYFKNAEVVLKKYKDEENMQKARYCQLAYNALTESIYSKKRRQEDH